MRIIWLSAGLTSLALAALGVVLPLLPATPFVILATFCLARSSPALHGWLLRHPTFGKALRDWRTRRAISRRSKALGVFAMALSLTLSLALGVAPVILAIQALALAGAAAFVLTRNSAA